VLQEEIFASSFAAAAYLKSINFPSDKKVQAFLSLDFMNS
jgi:phosphoglycolate phosphatase